jgi:hypothetical protein
LVMKFAASLAADATADVAEPKADSNAMVNGFGIEQVYSREHT